MSEDANEFAVRLKGWIDLFCREIADLKDRVAVLEFVSAMGWEAAIRSSRLTVASAPKNGHSWISAGLLDHRRVPTHSMFSELLARTFPSIEVNSSLLVARDGDIYSSGGNARGSI
jgi:transcriptional regulator GlxA family with amidase domain